MAVHTSHFGAMGAYVDGDTLSATAVLTDEAIQEVKDLLTRRDYYISQDNQFFFDIANDTLDAVLSYMT